jgi:hypothetical protein
MGISVPSVEVVNGTSMTYSSHMAIRISIDCSLAPSGEHMLCHDTDNFVSRRRVSDFCRVIRRREGPYLASTVDDDAHSRREVSF